MSLKSFRSTDKDVIVVEALDGGGFKMECKNEDKKGMEWGATYYGLVSYESLQNLEGKFLTIIDATFSDKEQRKAAKDIFRRTFWFDWVEHSIYKGKSVGSSVGMPGLLNQ